jgi:spermidine/putrescine-binding protein
VDGVHYGTPYMWGPNELMYNTKVFPEAPKSWNVVFEPMDLPEPYEPGKHYIETPLVQMPDAIRYYLEHPAERQRIVDEAYRFVTEKLTLRTSIRKILEIAAMEAAS